MSLRDLLGKAVRTVSGRRDAAAAPASERLLPLREAGQAVYDAMDGATFQMNRNLSAEGRLASMAMMLASQIPVYGCPPDSGEPVAIAREEFAQGSFRDGGNAFRRHADREDTWVRLAVREGDLQDTIRRLCARG